MLLNGDDDRSTPLTFTACALRAPDHAEHFVDVERDHASDLPEGYLTPWRTCQPFKGCCARQRRPRRRCEQRVVESKLVNIEADTVLYVCVPSVNEE